jgi:hypothetical protein
MMYSYQCPESKASSNVTKCWQYCPTPQYPSLAYVLVIHPASSHHLYSLYTQSYSHPLPHFHFNHYTSLFPLQLLPCDQNKPVQTARVWKTCLQKNCKVIHDLLWLNNQEITIILNFIGHMLHCYNNRCAQFNWPSTEFFNANVTSVLKSGHHPSIVPVDLTSPTLVWHLKVLLFILALHFFLVSNHCHEVNYQDYSLLGCDPKEFGMCVPLCQIMWNYIPQDFSLNTHHCRSHKRVSFYYVSQSSLFKATVL